MSKNFVPVGIRG